MTHLPGLYLAALFLTTAVLLAAGIIPPYVAMLVLALGLLAFAWRTFALARR